MRVGHGMAWHHWNERKGHGKGKRWDMDMDGYMDSRSPLSTLKHYNLPSGICDLLPVLLRRRRYGMRILCCVALRFRSSLSVYKSASPAAYWVCTCQRFSCDPAPRTGRTSWLTISSRLSLVAYRRPGCLDKRAAVLFSLLRSAIGKVDDLARWY